MLPSTQVADSSPFDFIPLSLNVMHVRIQRGYGVGILILGKSQVLSNSIEISIWTPPPPPENVDPPLIPWKSIVFFVINPLDTLCKLLKKLRNKKTKTNIKRFQGCFLTVWLGPPHPPPPSDKKFWIHVCIDHSTAHPKAHLMSEGTIWLCQYLGRIIGALTGGGGLLVLQNRQFVFPGFLVPKHFLCLLVPLKSWTYLPCSLEINAPLPCSPKPTVGPHQILTYTPMCGSEGGRGSGPP